MKTNFYVRPRYSGGSPAMVDESTALRVAGQEVEDYCNHLNGVYGIDNQKKANESGLNGIVYKRTEKYNKLFFVDLITGAEWMEKIKKA